MSKQLQSCRRIAKIFDLKHRLARLDLFESSEKLKMLEGRVGQVAEIKNHIVLPMETTQGSNIASRLEFRSRLIDVEQHQQAIIAQAKLDKDRTALSSNVIKRGAEKATAREKAAWRTHEARELGKQPLVTKSQEISAVRNLPRVGR